MPGRNLQISSCNCFEDHEDVFLFPPKPFTLCLIKTSRRLCYTLRRNSSVQKSLVLILAQRLGQFFLGGGRGLTFWPVAELEGEVAVLPLRRWGQMPRVHAQVHAPAQVEQEEGGDKAALREERCAWAARPSLPLYGSKMEPSMLQWWSSLGGNRGWMV